MPDRRVRFTDSFFDCLLPDERGADGSPPAADFLLYELPPVRDLLATVLAWQIFANTLID